MVKKGAGDIKVVMDKYLGHMIMCLDKGLFTNYVAIHGGGGIAKCPFYTINRIE